MTYEIPNDLGCVLDVSHGRHALPENRGGGWCVGLVPPSEETVYGAEALYSAEEWVEAQK